MGLREASKHADYWRKRINGMSDEDLSKWVDGIADAKFKAKALVNPITDEEVEAVLAGFDEAEEWSRRPPVAMRAALEVFLNGGLRIWWCQEHESNGFDSYCHRALAWDLASEDEQVKAIPECRMVEVVLLRGVTVNGMRGNRE